MYEVNINATITFRRSLENVSLFSTRKHCYGSVTRKMISLTRIANTAYSKNQNPYQKQFKRIKEKHLDNLYGCILYLKHIVET